jgi:hypothetical protein
MVNLMMYFHEKERNRMTKRRISAEEQNEYQKVIAAQNQARQFNKADTEFSLDENVQDALSKSQQYEVKNQQPTYGPNKPF